MPLPDDAARAALRTFLGRVHSRPRELRAAHFRLLRTRAPGVFRARDAGSSPLVAEGWDAPVPAALRAAPAPRGPSQTLAANADTLPRWLEQRVPALGADTLRLERRERTLLMARSWRRVAWVDAGSGALLGVVPVVPRVLAAGLAASVALGASAAVGQALLHADVTQFWLAATLGLISLVAGGAVVWRMLQPPFPWQV